MPAKACPQVMNLRGLFAIISLIHWPISIWSHCVERLETKEIVLHGADYDLRMLRRGLNLAASKIFDTLIAARLLGIREFSLAALVKRYFGLTLLKGSQKANWAQRPLPARMAEYAINDAHYLLPLAEKIGRRVGSL